MVITAWYGSGKSELRILNLSDGSLKKIDYQNNDNEIAGFIGDSKHLIIKRFYRSDTDIKSHVAIYLLNLDTLREAKIYSEADMHSEGK